jgi:serine/threonine-protein kinase
VTVFDVGECGDQPYIAMEFVEGRPLSDLLRDKKPLPTPTVLEIGIQLANALEYAHKRGIVHRDVKPSNIMMLKDSTTIKVADFGICRIEDSDATQKTRAGEVFGTPHYMSPEQVLGQRVDLRTDLFSAGVVLYQMLTGVLPFHGDTLVGVGVNIVSVEPESLDQLRPDLPLSLRRAVDRCLKKKPDKRFQSGGELASALDSVAGELAAMGQCASVRRRIPLRVRWAIVMACIVAATMSITTAFIHQRQYEAMIRQATSYGGSLAKFMATQSAEPLLAEDWVALEVFIQDTVSRQGFAYLQVVDHVGVIRGSDAQGQTGQPHEPVMGASVATEEAAVTVQKQATVDGRDVLDFNAPVQFQGKDIGSVHLGIYEAPLAGVARLTLMLLGLLILVTSAAVAAGSYLLASRLDHPLQVLRNSLGELAKGRYDYRIAEQRTDEFGEVYAAFDAAASALQKRHEPPFGPPEP